MPTIPYMTVEQMISMREALKWSVNRVAAETDIAAEDIQDIESGQRKPTPREKQLISDALRAGVSSTIVDTKVERTPPQGD